MIGAELQRVLLFECSKRCAIVSREDVAQAGFKCGQLLVATCAAELYSQDVGLFQFGRVRQLEVSCVLLTKLVAAAQLFCCSSLARPCIPLVFLLEAALQGSAGEVPWQR